MDVRLECIDEEVDDANFFGDDGLCYCFGVTEVEDEGLCSVILHGGCLMLGADEGIEGVVDGEVGFFPPGEKTAPEIAGGAGDEDVVGHFVGINEVLKVC